MKLSYCVQTVLPHVQGSTYTGAQGNFPNKNLKNSYQKLNYRGNFIEIASKRKLWNKLVAQDLKMNTGVNHPNPISILPLSEICFTLFWVLLMWPYNSNTVYYHKNIICKPWMDPELVPIIIISYKNKRSCTAKNHCLFCFSKYQL